jgi:hypothetical protein
LNLVRLKYHHNELTSHTVSFHFEHYRKPLGLG